MIRDSPIIEVSLVVVDSLLTVNPTRRPRGAPKTRAMRVNDGINFVFPTPRDPACTPRVKYNDVIQTISINIH